MPYHPVILKTRKKSYASFQSSIPKQMIIKFHLKVSGSLTAYEGRSRVNSLTLAAYISVWRQSMPTIVVMRYTLCTICTLLLCSPSEVTAAICYLKRECMYEKDGSRRRLFVCLYSSLWVSKPVAIKEFHPKEGAWEEAEKVQDQLPAIVLP